MDNVTEGSAWRNGSTKGAASELIACVHLMRQGWHVFRCESPSCPFDLAAYRNGEFVRVEVKSITWTNRARYAPAIPWPVNDEWDLLIAVDPDTCRCYEITSHDPKEGRQVIRTAYGFGPVTGYLGLSYEEQLAIANAPQIA
jgi:PD-(D/E)XK endonuclease